MQQESERWMYAQFLSPEYPAELFGCPTCRHWSSNGFRFLREARPGTYETCYSVYCTACDTFGPKGPNLAAAIEAWNLSSLTGIGRPRPNQIAFSVSI